MISVPFPAVIPRGKEKTHLKEFSSYLDYALCNAETDTHTYTQAHTRSSVYLVSSAL